MGEFNCLPLFQQGINEIIDGKEIHVPDFCAKRCGSDSKCQNHYMELFSRQQGAAVCPYGFASVLFCDEDGNKYAFTAMRLIDVYDAKKADPKVQNSSGKNHRKISSSEVQEFIELYLDYKMKTEAHDRLREFIDDIFHDLRKFNAQMKMKSNTLYRKAQAGKKMGQFLELSQSMLSICDYMTLRLNAYDFIYNEAPLTATEKCSYNIFKMFDKVRHCLSDRASEQNIKIEINCNGQCRDIKAYDCVELLPHILLDNGIKYASKGSSIDVKIEDTIYRCKFTVRSMGVGLSKDEQTKIFDRGFRGKAARQSNKEGLGIGLYIAKKICDVHSASIKADCQEDKKGTCFVVEVVFDREKD